MPLESVRETPNAETPRAQAPASPARTDARSSPAIYYVHPLLAGPLSGWGALLDRAAAMGFDHVAIAPPFQAGRGGNLALTADPDRIDARLGGGDALDGVARLAAACKGNGLALILDAVLDTSAPGGSQAAILAAPSGLDATLDPRVTAASVAAPTDFARSESVLWWSRRLRALADAGVAGFRLTGLANTPDAVLTELAQGVRGRTTLIGWIPGATLSARHTFRGAGLDFVASSLPWWDFDGGWFADELAALSAIAPVLMAPETPDGRRLAAACHDPALIEAWCRRAIGFAALGGQAWMLPMGAEYALARTPSPTDRPDDLAHDRDGVATDLSADIARWNAERLLLSGAPFANMASPPGAPVSILVRRDAADARRATRAGFVLANASLGRHHAVPLAPLLAAAGLGLGHLEAGDGDRLDTSAPLALGPGELRLLRGQAQDVPSASRVPVDATRAGKAPRIAIENVTPCIERGQFPAKRVIGDRVTVEADVIVDGHDQIGVSLLWRDATTQEWTRTPMTALGNDRWRASFTVGALGMYFYTVEAWRDAFATFRDELAKKHAAGVNTVLELREGVELAHAAPDLAERLATLDIDAQRALLLTPETAARMAEVDSRPFAVHHEPVLSVAVDRPGAAFASWYEIFPRSMSDDEGRHGTFTDVVRHLPRIRDMGFDVLYFPPIHPIGLKNRKGRNNSLTPSADDPGSPYAIGSKDGGHTSLHPQLGTLDDFRALREAAEAHGLELAIDFAVQCSPDHPWLTEHRDWFAYRPDGSIRYAENPPKKYEDIVNVDFYAEGARPALWNALAEAVLFWAEQGIRLFRVDNPHTKPLPFWEWLIAEVRARYPDAVFLAEAFTRPKVMYRLAKVGFGQSYTYFTWRNTKRELTEYLMELSQPIPREVFRPHFFVNTPDINPVFLQTGGRAAFLIRAALAATLSGLWGVYCGFELCEGEPVPGKEEYLNSEKYQIRAWDWQRPGNIVAEITRLNQIRRANPALHTHLDVRFHVARNEAILYYAKSDPERTNTVLVAVSLDPRQAQEADIEAPLWEWGLPDTGALDIEDLVRGGRSIWRGKMQHVRLDPSQPYAIWRVRPATRDDQ